MRLSAIIPERKNSIGWRGQIWSKSLTMISERPFFGHGINTFMRIFPAYYPPGKAGPTYAHNCYLQVAAETGIVGLFFFLFILFEIFKTSLKTLMSQKLTDKNVTILGFGILAGLLAFLFHSFTDTNLYSLQLSAYFWTMAGLLFSLNNLFNISAFHDISEHKNQDG